MCLIHYRGILYLKKLDDSLVVTVLWCSRVDTNEVPVDRNKYYLRKRKRDTYTSYNGVLVCDNYQDVPTLVWSVRLQNIVGSALWS